jgi:hypothetical protein
MLAHSDRTTHNAAPEQRGRKRAVSEEKLDEMEKAIEGSLEIRALPWSVLGAHVSLQLCKETIRTAMATRGYSKYTACQKTWKNFNNQLERLAFARSHQYEMSEFWNKVRFSDECHFGLGPHRKLKIIRKPGERYCEDCTQFNYEPSKKEKQDTVKYYI